MYLTPHELARLTLVRSKLGDTRAGSAADKELVAAAGVLARILAQDIERKEDGPRLKQGVAPDRLISVHDPEMRHGRKSSNRRFDGHKAQVAVDTDSQLITAWHAAEYQVARRACGLRTNYRVRGSARCGT